MVVPYNIFVGVLLLVVQVMVVEVKEILRIAISCIVNSGATIKCILSDRVLLLFVSKTSRKP